MDRRTDVDQDTDLVQGSTSVGRQEQSRGGRAAPAARERS
ncbi:hypothetical protein N566_01065 [Streptomycetaceae bacterium MP113-05]|nr:hypothetical protein N566_01065 [Streptomycetaceae bacterium MP113-05]